MSLAGIAVVVEKRQMLMLTMTLPILLAALLWKWVIPEGFYRWAVFSWVTKGISQLLWFCITTLCDWLKPIGVTWSHTFSRAWRRLHVFASSSHWFIDCLRLLWLAWVINLVLVSRHSSENCSIAIKWICGVVGVGWLQRRQSCMFMSILAVAFSRTLLPSKLAERTL